MSKAWTRVMDDLSDSPKVFRFAEVAGISRAAAFGCMVRWLNWVDAHCETAKTGLNAEVLDDVMFGIEGTGAALRAIGWVELVQEEPGEGPWRVRVAEFEKYLSPTSKKRALAARRVEKMRGKKADKESAAAGSSGVMKGGAA